ncbi:MAG: DUF4279 domain-containing protein [Bradyrhizobium sp.]
MSAISKTAASLRLFGDDLNPDDVTRLLGKRPDAAERRGEIVRAPSGRERVARQGLWRVQLERRAPGYLDGQIAELLVGTTEDLAVWQRLTSAYHVDVFCGLFLDKENEGICVSSQTLRLLGNSGIKLHLDIYAPD